jgi:hypothetical protein
MYLFARRLAVLRKNFGGIFSAALWWMTFLVVAVGIWLAAALELSGAGR